jgi:hypothetical protein
VISCTKKSDNTGGNDKTAQTNPDQDRSQNKTGGSTPSDTSFFGRWDGKRIIVDDYYKYSANEKLMSDTTGMGYDMYGNKLKELIGKYTKYDEKQTEYFFDDYKPEFDAYTSFKKGNKIYISSSSGVYSADITGFYINLDDMIGAGTVFYTMVTPPTGAKFDENEIVVCSFNNNMSAVNRKGVTNQTIIDDFKKLVMPKLKGVTISEYDDKGQPRTKPLEKISNEDIKIFEGSFTSKGRSEFLVSVRLQNDFTTFTSLIYVMDAEGKVISEFIPLAVNNFTFSMAEGIVDINGDGIHEVITYDGYYEGGGYNLNKYNGGLWKALTTGFVFGV